MVAELAREDFEDMRAEGLEPTLYDFDRLNNLALVLQNGPDTTSANSGRIAWAGDVVFFQPTLQSLAWFLEFGDRVSDDGETKNTIFAYACHVARTPHVFDGLTTPGEIEKRVRDWTKTLAVTREEVDRAVRYVTTGFNDAKAGRSPLLKEDQLTGAEERVQALASLRAKMDDALVKLGVSFADLWIETPSRLNALVYAWNIQAGREMKTDNSEASCAYKFALLEIRQRLTAERAEKEKAAKEAAGAGNG